MKGEEKRFPKVQMCIDPVTGKDITSEYIAQRLIELEELANKIISAAIKEYKENLNKKKEIYDKNYWEIQKKE